MNLKNHTIYKQVSIWQSFKFLMMFQITLISLAPIFAQQSLLFKKPQGIFLKQKNSLPILLAQATPGKPGSSDKKKDTKPKKPVPKVTQPKSVAKFGYLSFTIVPGFKRIRLDRETTIGFSENILVTAGSHWVEITSPKGYADSSFKIAVLNGQTIKKVIRLRSLVTGKIADMPLETLGKKQSKPWTWKNYVQLGLFGIGGIGTVMGLYNENKAKDAKTAYEALPVNAVNTPQGQLLIDEVQNRVKQRNNWSVISILGIVGGTVMFWF